MKLPVIAALAIVTLGLVGCDSLSDATDSVRERFSARNEARTRTFSSPPRVVYDAVKQAADRMGYRMTRGGPAQGEYEGVSGVEAGEAPGSARQVGLRVRLHGTLDGNSTDVSVRFTEILEMDSRNQMGMGTEATMRDTPLYEVFFRAVQQALGTRPAAQPVQTPAAPATHP